MTILDRLLTLLLILPWVNPFAGGPSPAVQPWLLALACGTLLWLYRGRLSPELILRGWLLAASISAAIGLLQYAGWSASVAPWGDSTPRGEAFGNLRQRNQFATLTNIGLAALLWLAAKNGRQGAPRQAGVLAAAVLLATANAASSSRTGILGLVLLSGFVGFWGGWRLPEVRRAVVAALIAYAVASVALPALAGLDASRHGIWSRLQQGDVLCHSRLTLWGNVLQLIAARPWTGWGWGELDYAHFMTLYPRGRFCEILDNAHNLPLHLAVVLGIPVAAFLCGATAVLIWRARPWKESEWARQAAWAVLGLILLHSMLEYPLWYGPFQIALLLCLWLLRGRPKATRDTIVRTVPRIRELAMAASVLGLTAYAAWDYHRVSQIYLPPEQRAEGYRARTVEKIRDSWLFSRQVRFAELSITPLTRENAKQINSWAHEMLHYSPEALVVEKLIESAVLLGRDDEAMRFLVRYQAAYPQEYARWAAKQARWNQMPGER